MEKLNEDNLDYLNNVIIETDTIKLCELSKFGNAVNDINKIVKEYSVISTFVLYRQFLKDRGYIEEYLKNDIDEYDKDLSELIKIFEKMDAIYKLKSEIEINKAQEYIRQLQPHLLFSPYGPLQKALLNKREIDNFVNNAQEAQEDHDEKIRKFFRLGIECKNEHGYPELIGCFTFDFGDHSIANYKATGDFGIFIHPEKRLINNNENSRTWRDVLFAATAFIENIFKYYYKDENMHISATTHYLNIEAHGILHANKCFEFICNKKTKNYGKRNHYLIPSSDFFKIFQQDNVEGYKNNITASYAKATCYKNGSNIVLFDKKRS